jgi:hypothetical protein
LSRPVKRGTRRRNKATGTPLSKTEQPNDLWCADYKGEFMLADRRYCYLLTIYRLRQPLPDCLRSLAHHQGDLCLRRVDPQLSAVLQSELDRCPNHQIVDRSQRLWGQTDEATLKGVMLRHRRAVEVGELTKR